MSSDQLLAQFTEQIDEFERYQGYVDKARALADDYHAEIVERVIAEYDEKKLEVVGAIMLVQADVEAAIAELRDQRQNSEDAASAARLGIEEHELRLAIGDLDDEGFARATATFRQELDNSVDTNAGIDAELESLSAALQRWETAGTAAGVLKAA